MKSKLKVKLENDDCIFYHHAPKKLRTSIQKEIGFLVNQKIFDWMMGGKDVWRVILPVMSDDQKIEVMERMVQYRKGLKSQSEYDIPFD